MKSAKKILYLFLIISIFFVFVMFPQTEISYGAAKESPEKTIQNRMKGAVAIYQDSMYALVNNKLTVIDPANELIVPFVQNGNMMVPIRFVAESFGVKISYDTNLKTAILVTGNKTVKIKLYSTFMSVGNKSIKLDVPAMSTGNRIFVPMKAVGEALGKKVFNYRGLVIISGTSDLFNKTSEKQLLDNIIKKINLLPTVGTREKLAGMLDKAGVNVTKDNYLRLGNTANKAESATMASDAQNAAMASGVEYSQTNIQVSGVDEADIVKTDGSYIYQLSNHKVLIYKAYPADKMVLEGTILFSDGQFNPEELYIRENKLVIIGSS